MSLRATSAQVYESDKTETKTQGFQDQTKAWKTGSRDILKPRLKSRELQFCLDLFCQTDVFLLSFFNSVKSSHSSL